MDERVTVVLPPHEHEPAIHAPDERMEWELRGAMGALPVEEAQAVFDGMAALMLEAVDGDESRANLFLRPHVEEASEEAA